MKRIFRLFCACVAIWTAIIISGCDDKKIDDNIISTGSAMSAEAIDKAKSLDKESYKEIADLFLDTGEIDFSRDVLIIFGKNQCKYCDMMKDDIKKSATIQEKIRENFNPYYINTSYEKTHKLRGFGGESSTSSLRVSKANEAIQKNKVDCHDSARCTESRNDNASAPQDEFEIPTARFAQIFAVNATPQIVFLDKNMRVKYLFAGYTLKLEKMIDDVVASPAPMGDYAQIDKTLNELKKDTK